MDEKSSTISAELSFIVTGAGIIRFPDRHRIYFYVAVVELLLKFVIEKTGDVF
jgi:hypothetical protein